MTFRHGKFYNEQGQVVPLEFGNTTQIEILQKIEALREGVLVIGIFVCPCGYSDNPVWKEDLKFKCGACNARYAYYLYEDEVPCIKKLD